MYIKTSTQKKGRGFQKLWQHKTTILLGMKTVISQVRFIATSKNMGKLSFTHISVMETQLLLFFWVRCSPFEELLWGEHPFLYKVIEQQANAFSGDGPAFKYHLNASLHEHIQQ